MRWPGYVARMREKTDACRTGGKPERKQSLGRPRRKWVDNIKMDHRDIGVVWTGLIWLQIGASGGLL
jgi:hypothetical protein